MTSDLGENVYARRVAVGGPREEHLARRPAAEPGERARGVRERHALAIVILVIIAIIIVLVLVLVLIILIVDGVGSRAARGRLAARARVDW